MRTLPVIALRGMTVLPGMLVHFDINRPITIEAVDAAMEGDRSVFVTNQKDSEVEEPSFYDLYEVGVIANIKQIVKLQDGIRRVMIETRQRGTMLTTVQTKPYLIADVVPYDSVTEELDSKEAEAKIRTIRDYYKMYMVANPKVGKSIYEKINQEEDLGTLIDLVGMNLMITTEARQDLLECFSVDARYELLMHMLANEVEISKIQADFKEKVQEEVSKNQKDYFLREQMKVIRDELGEGQDEDDTDRKSVV